MKFFFFKKTINFMFKLKQSYMKASRDTEEMLIIERCASFCKDLSPEKIAKINFKSFLNQLIDIC